MGFKGRFFYPLIKKYISRAFWVLNTRYLTIFGLKKIFFSGEGQGHQIGGGGEAGKFTNVG